MKGQEFSLKEKEGPFLLLDCLQDVGNFGSIVRTADFYGVKTIFKSPKCAPNNEVVARISKNASKHLKITEVSNLLPFTKKLKNLGYWICSSFVDSKEIFEEQQKLKRSPLRAQQCFLEHNQVSILPSKENLVLLIGNEEKGIRNLLLSESDYILHIPSLGKTECLNAAVATAVLLDRIVHR